MMDFLSSSLDYDTIGLMGVALYIGSYAGLQLRLIRGSGYIYTLMNGGAASLVLVSLTHTYNLSSVLIQISWILISIYGLYRLSSQPAEIWFAPEESDMKQQIFRFISDQSARKLLDAGEWQNLRTGKVLAHEGQPIEQMYYLAEGVVEIIGDGRSLATAGPGTMIGEVTYQDGSPATATVVATSACRVFSMRVGTLRKILARDETLRADLEQSLAHHMREKLRQLTLQQTGDAVRAYQWSRQS